MFPDMFFLTSGSPLLYIDGGTGSLIFQALLGGFLTVGYFASTKWALLKAKFATIKRKPGSGSEG